MRLRRGSNRHRPFPPRKTSPPSAQNSTLRTFSCWGVTYDMRFHTYCTRTSSERLGAASAGQTRVTLRTYLRVISARLICNLRATALSRAHRFLVSCSRTLAGKQAHIRRVLLWFERCRWFLPGTLFCSRTPHPPASNCTSSDPIEPGVRQVSSCRGRHHLSGREIVFLW